MMLVGKKKKGVGVEIYKSVYMQVVVCNDKRQLNTVAEISA